MAGGPPPEPRTSSWLMAVLAALGVLAVIALGIGLALTKGGDAEKPSTTTMPNLEGMTENQARDVLSKLGLTGIKAGEPDKDDNCTKNRISQQTPPANTTVGLTDTGSYSICVGPDLVTVPDLVGSTADSARAALEKLKLDPKINEVDSDRQEDTVLDIEKKGEQVPPGTEITLTVSKGNLVAVPNVIGRSEDVASGILQSAGFKVTVVPGAPSDTPDEVTRQSHTGKRPKGSTITITVSTEATPSPDPSGGVSPAPGGSDAPPGSGGGEGGPIGDLFD
jgi:serine/threonine-protein kinase